MKTDQFDDLLIKLPKIAEAVNVFSSEEVQKQAFQVLVTALGVAPVIRTQATESSAAEKRSAADDEDIIKPVRKAPRKSKTTSAKVPDRLQDIDLQTTLEGYPDFHSLTKKSDKLLWVLQYAQTAGITSLSNVEIVFLSDRLGDGIPSTDINGYYKSNLKKSFVNRSLQDKAMRILPQGSTYLKDLLQKTQ